MRGEPPLAGVYELAHLPERDGNPEVDFILAVGTRRIPIEVKYRRKIDYEDTRGLVAFLEKSVNNAPLRSLGHPGG